MKWENKVTKGNVFHLKECPLFWDHLLSIFFRDKTFCQIISILGFIFNEKPVLVPSFLYVILFYFFLTGLWKKKKKTLKTVALNLVMSSAQRQLKYVHVFPKFAFLNSGWTLHGRTLCLSLESIGYLNSQGFCFSNIFFLLKQAFGP